MSELGNQSEVVERSERSKSALKKMAQLLGPYGRELRKIRPTTENKGICSLLISGIEKTVGDKDSQLGWQTINRITLERDDAIKLGRNVMGGIKIPGSWHGRTSDKVELVIYGVEPSIEDVSVPWQRLERTTTEKMRYRFLFDTDSDGNPTESVGIYFDSTNTRLLSYETYYYQLLSISPARMAKHYHGESALEILEGAIKITEAAQSINK